MNYKIYMLMFGRLPSKPTGIARSVIRRANALNKTNNSCEILVYEYDIDFENEIKLLKGTNQLDKNIGVRYLWNDLSHDDLRDRRRERNNPPEEKGYVVLQDKIAPNIYRCYKDGLYLKYKYYRPDGKLLFIDYLKPNFIREKREWYDLKGYVRKVEYMDPSTNKPSRIILLNKKGKCYLSIAKNPKNLKTTHIIWFDKNGKFIKEFVNEDELIQYWLQNFILKNKEENSILISEYGFKYKHLNKLKKEKLAIIYTFHNNHFDKPYNFGSPIRKEHIDFLSNLDKMEAVVFLTNEQREDIEKQFGNKERIFTIPHHAPYVEVDDSKREDNTVVCLGRFEPVKNHAHAVLAFKKVVKYIPEAKLELYGRGSQEDKLKQLIKENNLEKNVLIKGFTTNSMKVFERATLSLVPSDYEGICLSLMESMSCGCPVISYNFKYGPKDIIENNVNGIIVEKYNIEDLSDAIIDLLKNKKKRTLLSTEARKITSTFSEKRLINNWLELFDHIYKKKNII